MNNLVCGVRYVKAYHLPIDLEFPKSEEGIDIGVLKRDEAKAFASSRFAIHHDCRVDNLPVLGEVLTHRFRCDCRC